MIPATTHKVQRPPQSKITKIRISIGCLLNLKWLLLFCREFCLMTINWTFWGWPLIKPFFPSAFWSTVKYKYIYIVIWWILNVSICFINSKAGFELAARASDPIWAFPCPPKFRHASTHHMKFCFILTQSWQTEILMECGANLYFLPYLTNQISQLFFHMEGL